MRYLGLLLVAVAVAVSACDDKSDAPQVQQGGTSGAAARRWAVEMPDFTRDLFDALAEHAAFTGDILATWGTPANRKKSPKLSPSIFILIQARFNGLRLRAQALPEGTPEINAVNLALVRGLDVAVQAYDSYLARIEEGRFKPLGARRRAYGPSASRLARARPALKKVLGVPTEGTIVAEGKENQSGSITSPKPRRTKRLDLLMDSAPALKHRRLQRSRQARDRG